MANKKPRCVITLCAGKKLKPETAKALAKVFTAVYKRYARRCIDRGSHIACGRGD